MDCRGKEGKDGVILQFPITLGILEETVVSKNDGIDCAIKLSVLLHSLEIEQVKNRNFYHPYLLTRREPMHDMDPNPCALDNTGL